METKKSRDHLTEKRWNSSKKSASILTTFSLGFTLVIASCSGNLPNKPVGETSQKKAKVLPETKKTPPTAESDTTEEKKTPKVIREEPVPRQTPSPLPPVLPSPREPWERRLREPLPPRPMPNPPRVPIPPEEEIINFPDVEASFPGGIAEMVKWINENIKYPEEAPIELGYGKIYMSFIVEKDGSLTDIKVERGISKEFDSEAKRLIQGMPNWKPGELNEKVVRTRVRLPIVFHPM